MGNELPDYEPGEADSQRCWSVAGWLAVYWPVLVICGVAAVGLFWQLGEGTLLDWDEAIYGQISREMVQSGEWLTPHWGYRPRLHKPPLAYWATAVLFQLFEVNEFWARAASVLSAVGVVAVVYLMAHYLYGRRAAVLAGVILLTSHQFVWSARFGTSDVMLTLFLMLALYGYLRLREGDGRWWYWIGASCGLAFMVKSAASLVGPAAVGCALLWDGQVRVTLRSRSFWGGLLLAGVIVLPWHVLMLVQHSDIMIDAYFGRNMIRRATTTLAGHSGGPGYYLKLLLERFFPWAYLIPLALVWQVRVMGKGDGRLRVVLAFIAIVLGIFTAAQTKLPWYIVPVYPVLALLVGAFVGEFRGIQGNSGEFRGTRGNSGELGGTQEMKVGGWRLALVGVLGVVLVGVAVNRLRPIYHRVDEPLARLAQQAERPVTGERPELLLVYGEIVQPTVQYYSNRPVDQAARFGELNFYLREGRPVEIIISREDMAALAERAEWEVLAEVEGYVYASVRKVGE